MWGGELVLRDGLAVGQVTSAAWGETLGSCVALAYVWRRDGDVVTSEYLNDGHYEINVGGNVLGASLHLKPPFDPTNVRVKC
jgi:glycine cleavage system aminomethyltransferase T